MKFRKPDGTFADSGFVSVQHSAEVKLLFEGQLSGDTLPIECRDEQLTVVQRIPGCVAKRIRFIEPLKDAPTIVELQESSPITLRVIDGEGNPVSDADVRYFTYTTGKSSSHAFPMDGIKGAIHGTSDIEGNVAIDFLDPIEAGKAETMGNKLYWFYIEHPELAPTFVGPYEAGTQQEDVVLGEYLEIKGEVHGTPEELRNFAAEWDQPERLMRGNGIDYWIYADSAKLSIDFEDGKGTFTLSGLRPGKLRFIVTFAPRPHSVKHSYSRRDPGPDDVVFEFDVTESRDDIVLVPGNGFEEPADSSASGDGITDDGRP